MGGYTLWARKTLESEIFLWKPDKWFKIWYYIVNKVNWKDGQFPRGTGYMTYDDIKVATHATQDQVKHCIEYLKIRQMIATQKATRGMVVTILNYEEYQDPGNYGSHTESQLKATQKPHRSHTIIKEREEGKEKNPPISPQLSLSTEMNPKPTINEIAKEILIYLNEKTGKNFRLDVPENLKYIKTRLKGPYTKDELIYVIDVKVVEWKGDSEHDKHLNPITLFRPANFEKYLNQAKEKTEKEKFDENMKKGGFA